MPGTSTILPDLRTYILPNGDHDRPGHPEAPDDNWTTMTGAGSTWAAPIPLEPSRTSIDLVTTHTVTVGGNTIPISAPYTRVALD